MSTFKGIVREFPQIRIDYFRRVAHEAPPLACFLSHVHSDHLQGLESLKAPFVYCSPATREILLRLEKYPHRMNFARGILESRVQTYRHLKNLLKSIPLETPTVIELRPGYEIRVTLFDANHCVGAVMFLIEGQGKSILYTGDIRSEPWWVNQLVQSPVLLPYSECVKILDCIYLDTTFASKSNRYRDFPSKADGLKELVKKVSRYPQDTTFYVEAWTFGYENVWIALSSLLNSQVHLDPYRWSLYRSLANTASGAVECPEARQLCGFQLGNHSKEGCLTPKPRARLHSCEKGTGCPVVQGNPNMVRIVPIVSRLPDGAEMHEMGLGGGNGDLNQTHELEVTDAAALGALMQLCAKMIEDKDLLLRIFTLLNSSSSINLGSEIENKLAQDEIKLEELIDILGKVSVEQNSKPPMDRLYLSAGHLPTTITFPYSRHSSYSELCHLVQAFKPIDVYPCTVDDANWTPAVSMRSLFGQFCSGALFVHDAGMMELYEERDRAKRRCTDQSQASKQTQETGPAKGEGNTQSSVVSQNANLPADAPGPHASTGEEFFTPAKPSVGGPLSSSTPIKPSAEEGIAQINHSTITRPFTPSTPPNGNGSKLPRSRKIRKWAYMAAIGLDHDCDTWDAFGGLKCVQRQASEEEL